MKTAVGLGLVKGSANWPAIITDNSWGFCGRAGWDRVVRDIPFLPLQRLVVL